MRHTSSKRTNISSNQKQCAARCPQVPAVPQVPQRSPVVPAPQIPPCFGCHSAPMALYRRHMDCGSRVRLTRTSVMLRSQERTFLSCTHWPISSRSLAAAIPRSSRRILIGLGDVPQLCWTTPITARHGAARYPLRLGSALHGALHCTSCLCAWRYAWRASSSRR